VDLAELVRAEQVAGRDPAVGGSPQPVAAANAADFLVRTLQLGGLVETTETARPGQR
jgi:hypothetical protein